MYNIISTIITILLIPIWLPIVLLLALNYKWQDTVPKEETKNDK